MFLIKHSYLCSVLTEEIENIFLFQWNNFKIPMLQKLILYFYLLNLGYLHRFVYFTGSLIHRIEMVLGLHFSSPLTPAIFSKYLIDAGSKPQWKNVLLAITSWFRYQAFTNSRVILSLWIVFTFAYCHIHHCTYNMTTKSVKCVFIWLISQRRSQHASAE